MYGCFDSDVCVVFGEVCFDVIDVIGKVVVEYDVVYVLVVGDVFDIEGLEDCVIV